MNSLFEYIHTFPHGSLVDHQRRADLHRAATESDGTEHQYALVEASLDDFPREVAIGLLRAWVDTGNTGYQALPIHGAELRNLLLHLLELRMHHIAYFFRVACQVFFQHQVNGCESSRAANRIAGMRGSHAA